MFSKELNKKLDKYHLIKHPFYKSWNEGKLTREIIKDYAEQYYQHVKAFPRYISATHSICEDLEKRKILLENLNQNLKNGFKQLTFQLLCYEFLMNFFLFLVVSFFL